MKEIDNPCLKELIDQLPGTVLQAEANSTVKCYSSSWQRWKRWSMEKLGKCELPVNPMHVALYLQDLIKDAQEKSKSPAVISSAVYGINWAHQVALMSSPTDHVFVQALLIASKRILGRPLNPKEPLEIEMIQTIASFYNSSELSLSAMRFLFVLLVGHSGMLRADELLSIRYKDIEFFEDRMVIFVPKRKNDQHREGHFSNIRRSNKSTCPVSFTEKLLSLLPDEKGSPFPVLRRIVQKKERKRFHHSHSISYSTLTLSGPAFSVVRQAWGGGLRGPDAKYHS